MGRKAISGKRKTDTPLRIRLTDDERALVDRAAAADGLPSSTWARSVVINAAWSKVGTPLWHLGVDVRFYNQLKPLGIVAVEQLKGVSVMRLLALPNFGAGSLKKLAEALKSYNIRIEGWHE